MKNKDIDDRNNRQNYGGYDQRDLFIDKGKYKIRK